MAIPTCLITDLITKTENRLCRSRLYWVPDTPPTSSTNMVTLANSVMANYATVLPAILSPLCYFFGVYVRWTDPAVELDGYSTSTAIVGTGGVSTTVSLPDEVCMEVQRRTGLTGRQNRGRLFFSGIASPMNDGGLLTPAARVNLIALAAKIGPDQTFAPIGLCHARHFDRKDNVLKGVQAARATSVFVSRRDRRRPLSLIPI